MNSPTPIKDEPLRLHEVAFASVIVCTAAASLAVAFTTIATCQYVGDTNVKCQRRRASK